MGSLDNFLKYDFQSSENWNQYRNRLEIPHGKENSDVMMKFKARWYQNNVDENLQIDEFLNTLRSEVKQQRQQQEAKDYVSTSAPQGSTSNQNNNQSKQDKGAEDKNKTSKSNSEREHYNQQRNINSQGSSGYSGLLGMQSLLFLQHVTLLVLAVGTFLPLPPIMVPSYKYFMILAVVVQALRTYKTFGLPPFRSLEQAKQWAVPVVQSSDAQYIMYTTILFNIYPIQPAVLPVAILACYHTASYIQKNFGTSTIYQKYIKIAQQWLVQNQANALRLNAICEIIVGFQLILRLFIPQYRSIFATMGVINFLKMRYQHSDASAYHRMVWSQLGQTIDPYVSRVPILQQALGYIQRWFRGY